MNRIANNPLDQLVRKENHVHSESTEQEETRDSNQRKYKRYPLSLPIEIHAKIKIKAYSEGKTMNQMIISFIEKQLKIK